MNVSYAWLRALAPGLEDSPEELARRLAMYGAPVEEMTAIGEPLADIVVARVEAVREHPNADRLALCDVDAGTGERLQIVCGAPNVRPGEFYPFAPVGAVLPGGLEIRKAKIRGQASQGMLCSERELGLGRDHAGIMALRGSLRPGEPLVPALGLDDVRLTLEVTPNRPDLLSHLGVARELAPGGRAGIRLPTFPASGDDADAETAGELDIERGGREGGTGDAAVRIDDAGACPRYMGLVLRDLRVGPSPGWLAARLRSVGLRPINNVVDATNYVLYELGQPLHAFDLDRLAGGTIVVRRARAGERITTLDGETRALDEDMLVIADAEDPVALAGIMGGADSEVTAETTAIFLECALFDPKTVRSTRSALGLSTDSSYRFERGVDPEGLPRAIRRAAELIRRVAGGRAATAVDLYPEPAEAPVVPLRSARASQVLGRRFEPDELVGYLEPLGFEPVRRDDGAVRFRVPGHRWYDIEREIDLVEEIARRHGYDRFDDELRPFRPTSVPEDPLAGLEHRLRRIFAGRGFLEARTAPFAAEDEGDVTLLRPLSAEESRLRRALVPGLVHRIEYNFARGLPHIRLFELGTAFAAGADADGRPGESTRIAAVFTGQRRPPHWTGDAGAFELWDVKALLGDLAAALGADRDSVEPWDEDESGWYEDGSAFRVADASGATIGWGGRVAPERIDSPAWAEPVWAVEAVLEPRMAMPPVQTFRPIPSQPPIERDLALLVPDEVPAARVDAVVRDAGGEFVETAFPFDLYRGRGIPEATRSIAYRLRFRAPDRTLKDEEADHAVGRILERLEEELGVVRR